MTRAFRFAFVFLVGLGLLGGLSVSTAQAQHPTAVTSIINSAQDTTLEVNHNGSLLVPGTYFYDGSNPENDSIPAEGAGTRLMWYPAKAAIRAGGVGGTQWNAGKIGDYSVAFGRDTKATDPRATAMGDGTTASGINATAMGDGTTASGNDATAMGDGTTASGNDATAMGKDTEASGGDATAMGNGTTASGINATAMGNGTTASGNGATAMGRDTEASGGDATAMGNGTIASGSNATAMGRATTASGFATAAMGLVTKAVTPNSLSIGECNSANTSDDNTLFAAGNGSSAGTLESCQSRSDALVLDRGGNLTISGTLTENSDRRLKTEIEPLRDRRVLKKLARLRPVRYQFKNQDTHPSGEQIGLIAQDVRKEFPSLVKKGSGGMLSLAYPRLPVVLLKGLQEQQLQIDSLEKRVRQVESLKKRVARLEDAAGGDSLVASLPGGDLLLGILIGGLFSAGLLWRRRV